MEVSILVSVPEAVSSLRPTIGVLPATARLEGLGSDSCAVSCLRTHNNEYKEPLASPCSKHSFGLTNPLVFFFLGLQLSSILRLVISFLSLAHPVLALDLSLGYKSAPLFFIVSASPSLIIFF